MEILVTGGAGFIGSHLCDRLLAAGHRVTAADNFLTGSRENLAHQAGNPKLTLLDHDVSTPLPDHAYDRIYHLASPASPVGYGRKPIETMLVNAQGTYHLLELARRHGSRFLFASTSEIYGDPLVHPQPEDYWGNVNPIGPRACYDESKRYGEAITINFVWEYGLDARIVRIFNCYGPRSDPEDGRIVPNFVTQAITGRPITVFGDGSQTRSYCYVSDLVRGLEAVMEAPDLRGEVFNLGNPDEYSALEFARVIRRLAGSDSPIVHEPPRPEEIARRRPDITKARTRLGWQPEVPLEQGMAETIAWFRERLKAATH